jgi:hypothetical protein
MDLDGHFDGLDPVHGGGCEFREHVNLNMHGVFPDGKRKIRVNRPAGVARWGGGGGGRYPARSNPRCSTGIFDGGTG